MTTGATGQLGLALPVQGELSGTWGDTVNNGLTQYINIAIAGTLTLTNDGAVTLANTTGDASASNVTSTLTGAGTVTAQFAIVRVTGTLTTAKVVTAPSYSKTYTVVNAATGGIVTFKASGQTGVSIAVGESAFVYFNGTDYVKVSGTASVTSFSAGTTGLTPSTSTTGAVTLAGTLAIANGGTGQTTANTALNALLPSQTGNANKYLQTDGTNSSWDAVSLSTADITGTLGTANGGTGLTSFTSGGVVYASSTSALATGSALTFDGTNLGVGIASATSLLDVRDGVGSILTLGNTGNFAIGEFSRIKWKEGSTQLADIGWEADTNELRINNRVAYTTFYASNAEALRLTSTSLYTASGINVGFGTSSPAYKLDVSAGSGTGIRFKSTGAYGNFIADNTGTTGGGSYSAYQNGVQITIFGVEGAVLGNTSKDTAILNDVVGGGIKLYTNSSATPKATLDSAGNLGIGTSSPAYKLDVNQAAVGFPGFRISGSNSPGMQIAETSGTVTSHFVNDSAGCYFGTTTSHPLVFRTANTERARIDSSGNVGIGTSSPSQKLEVSGTILAKTTSTPAIIARSTSTGMKVFYDDGRTEFTAVNYDGISTVGAQDLFITSGQKATFGVNSNSSIIYPLEITTAGVLSIPYGQIKFPATQSASSDANTLDDYEEGTWTPVLNGGWTVVGATTLSGRYTKIGNLVYIEATLAAATSIACTANAGAAVSGFSGIGAPAFNSANAGYAKTATGEGLGNAMISASGFVFQPIGGIGATTEIVFSGTYRV